MIDYISNTCIQHSAGYFTRNLRGGEVRSL
jgi:hypothetical protein